MKKFLWANKFLVAGIILGAVGGFAYYHFFGCNGTCTITSSPRNSTLYGAMMGALVFSVFKQEKNTKSINDKKSDS